MYLSFNSVWPTAMQLLIQEGDNNGISQEKHYVNWLLISLYLLHSIGQHFLSVMFSYWLSACLSCSAVYCSALVYSPTRFLLLTKAVIIEKSGVLLPMLFVVLLHTKVKCLGSTLIRSRPLPSKAFPTHHTFSDYSLIYGVGFYWQLRELNRA
jgi:hypothetical protein